MYIKKANRVHFDFMLSLKSQSQQTLVTIQAHYYTMNEMTLQPHLSLSLAGDKTRSLAHTTNSQAISWEKKLLGYL